MHIVRVMHAFEGREATTEGAGPRTRLDQGPPLEHVALVGDEVDAGLLLGTRRLLQFLHQPGASAHCGVRTS